MKFFTSSIIASALLFANRTATALRDPQHSDHQKALAYFGRDDSWLILRWFWIDKFHLKTPDAVTFLGGRETDRARRVLICYLDRDAQALGDPL